MPPVRRASSSTADSKSAPKTGGDYDLMASMLDTTSKLKAGEIIKGTDTERGMVFQKPTLFLWLTVEENLNFTATMKKQRHNPDYMAEAERLLELAGLSEFRHDFPHQLSGGMAQRLALIRTMINHPKVFLLDEPLGALDAFTRMNMQIGNFTIIRTLK